MTLTRKQADLLYRMAVEADVDYSLVIRAKCSPLATRWNLTRDEEAIPEVQRAYRRKVDADRTLLLHAQKS